MIILKTEEQRTEMIARCIYLLSNLRAWQRDGEGLYESKNKDPDIAKWEVRCDEFLKNIDAVEFKSLKKIISEITIKI